MYSGYLLVFVQGSLRFDKGRPYTREKSLTRRRRGRGVSRRDTGKKSLTQRRGDAKGADKGFGGRGSRGEPRALRSVEVHAEVRRAAVLRTAWRKGLGEEVHAEAQRRKGRGEEI